MSKVEQCKYCAKSFIPRTKRQQFCRDGCRWRYWAESHPRSEAFKGVELTPCIYCGLPADTIDHIPPKIERARLVALNLIHRYQLLEVDACHECNSVLGCRPLWTIRERKRLIKAYLARKYRRYLKMPNWSDEELGNLGYTLSSSVLAAMIKSQIIKARIEW